MTINPSMNSKKSEKKAFLLRIDKETFNILQKWADDDLRSLNGQIEFLLKRSIKEAGRNKKLDS